jgi:hypothetical protein
MAVTAKAMNNGVDVSSMNGVISGFGFRAAVD